MMRQCPAVLTASGRPWPHSSAAPGSRLVCAEPTRGCRGGRHPGRASDTMAAPGPGPRPKREPGRELRVGSQTGPQARAARLGRHNAVRSVTPELRRLLAANRAAGGERAGGDGHRCHPGHRRMVPGGLSQGRTPAWESMPCRGPPRGAPGRTGAAAGSGRACPSPLKVLPQHKAGNRKHGRQNRHWRS